MILAPMLDLTNKSSYSGALDVTFSTDIVSAAANVAGVIVEHISCSIASNETARGNLEIGYGAGGVQSIYNLDTSVSGANSLIQSKRIYIPAGNRLYFFFTESATSVICHFGIIYEVLP